MQKAVFVTEIKKPLVLGTRAIPTPSENEVLIKVAATMLLPHDTYGLNIGIFIADHLPFILGTNIAGTITALGPNVTSFSVGDQIFGLGNPMIEKPDQSGLQEYAILPTNSVARLPSGFDFDQMVTFPVNAVTSFSALFNPRGFGFPAPFQGVEWRDLKDEAILIVGGGSNVGKFAIQYAALAGIGKILTLASVSGTKELKSLGATHIIDRHASDAEIRKQISEATEGKGIDKIYDCVSWDYTNSVSLLSTEKHGTLLVLHLPGDIQKIIDEKKLDVRVEFILGIRAYMEEQGSPFWKNLPDWVKEGKLRVGKYQIIEGLDSLEKIEAGLESYSSGQAVVPVIVHP